MGKASSNKKVARAAGTGGGRTGRSNTPWSYYGLIAVVVILGVTFTWTSRVRYEHATTSSSTATAAPAVGTTWYEAMDTYICGSWQTPLAKETTKTGLSPLGDGVIKIAPKTKAVSGKNATLGNFAKSVTGFTLTSDSIKLPGGKVYKNGDKCDGKSGHLYVKEYTYVGQAAGVIQTTSAPKVRLANGALLTVAFVPSSQQDSITAPPESVQSALKDTTTTASTTTTSTSTTSTTTPTSTTTAKSSTTTAKSSTTTAKSSSKSKSKSKKS